MRNQASFKPPTFIKWAGGKTQLLEQLQEFIPSSFNRYIEPFVGSGAVFFFIKERFNSKVSIIMDINEELINTFNVIKKEPEKLIELLKEHRKRHSHEHYYSIRQTNPKSLSRLEAAARFIYLNKTCYNGLFRVNSKGGFNVPMGRYENPSIVNEGVILKASQMLKNAVVKVQPFQEVLKVAKNGDFVYFDPPYYPLSKTSSFTSYTKGVFLEKEQEELARVFRKLDKMGCKLVLSNSDTPFIKDLYNGYNIRTVSAKRFINSNGSKRGAISELVITN